MKKLIALIGAVATAFGLYADEPAKFAISFEAAEDAMEMGVDTTSMTFTPGGDDWTWESDPLTLNAYEGDAFKYGTGAFARREGFADQGLTQENYLKLETGTNTLARAVNGNIFLDQLVKFTGFEEPQTNVVAGTKIAVWMSGVETEGTEGEGDYNAGETNLYVTVGRDSGTAIEPIALKIGSDGDYKLDTWYRLTIKSIGDVFGGAEFTTPRAGFIVYINGVQVACSDPVAKALIANEGSMTAVAAGYMAKGQLFPAIDVDNATFATVGYQGIGWVDDIMLDSEGPEFAKTVDVTADDLAVAGAKIVKVEQEGAVVTGDGAWTVKPGDIVVYYAPDGAFVITGDGKATWAVSAEGVEKKSGMVEDEDIVPADVLVVSTGNVTNYYTQAQFEAKAFGTPATFVDGDVITVLQSIYAEDAGGNPLYAFTPGTTIAIADQKAGDVVTACKWNVTVPDYESEGETVGGYVTFNLGIEPQKQIEVTFAAEEPTEDNYVEFSGVIAGEGAYLKVNNGTLTASGVMLVGDAKVITATAIEGYEEIFLNEEKIEEKEVGGFFEYSIKQGESGFAVIIADSTTTNYYKTTAQALEAVQAAEGSAMVKVIAYSDGIVQGPNGQTLTLAVGDVIIINNGTWAFSQLLTGTVTLEPGKAITAAGIAQGAAINVPTGYVLATTDNKDGTFTYEAAPTYTITYVCAEHAIAPAAKTVTATKGKDGSWQYKFVAADCAALTTEDVIVWDGWYNGDKKASTSMIITGDVTLTAAWKTAVVKYTDANGIVTYKTNLAPSASGTYELLDDFETSGLTIGALASNRNVIIDLGGKTLTLTRSSGNPTISMATNYKTSTVTIRNGTITMVPNETGVGMVIRSTGNIVNLEDDLTINCGAGNSIVVLGDGCTLNTEATITTTGKAAAIQTNGSDTKNATINVKGGSITSDNLAIFAPGDQTLNISGGTITGATAVEVRGGSLNITGGTLVATATDYSVKPNGSGSTTIGAAVAVAQHTTEKAIDVSIAGATLTGVKAVSVANPQGNDATNVEVELGAATYNGALAFSADGNAAVTKNGAVIDAPADYKWDENGNLVAKVYIVQVGTEKFETLAEAVAAAEANDEVTLLADTTLNATLTIDKALAFNLAGKTITFGDGVQKGITTEPAGFEGDLVISNGAFAVVGTRPAKGYAFVLYRVDALIKDVEMDLTGFEYGLEAETMLGKPAYWTEELTHEITCENVAVTGNGSLFHFENVIATLDEDCSATAAGTSFGGAHEAAIYSSCGAIVTVNGGTYTAPNALQTGNLGGKIIVNDGDFIGNIKSFMYKGDERWEQNTATIKIVDGSFDGNFAFAEGQPGPCTKDEVIWDITGGQFSADPTAYLADGYVAEGPDGEGWYSVVQRQEEPVAKIGNVEYTSLQAAFDAAQAGETVELLDNVEVGATVTVADFRGTFDLGGYSISTTLVKGDDATFSFEGACDVVITNGTMATGGEIDIAGTSVITIAANTTLNNNGAYGVYVYDAATLNIYGTINNSGKDMPCVWMGGTSVVNTYDGCVVNSAGDPFRINGNGRTINFHGGSFHGAYPIVYAYNAGNASVINVFGGTFDSDNGLAGGGAKDTIVVTPLTDACTAKFSRAAPESGWFLGLEHYCAPGYAPVKGDDGYYTIQAVWDVTFYVGDVVSNAQVVVNGECAKEFAYDTEAIEAWTNATGDAFAFTTPITETTTLFAQLKAQGIVPGGEPVPVSGGTQEEAEAEAAKLPIKLTPEQTAAGLTTADFCNKVRQAATGGYYEAYVEVAPANAPVIETESTDVKPIEVGATDFSATISNAKPGLYYGFKAVDALGDTFEPVGKAATATAAGDLTIKAPKGEGNACFYKLTVSITDIWAK